MTLDVTTPGEKDVYLHDRSDCNLLDISTAKERRSGIHRYRADFPYEGSNCSREIKSSSLVSVTIYNLELHILSFNSSNINEIHIIYGVYVRLNT